MTRPRKILITGATGRVAGPVALSCARDSEVWALARFSDPATKAELEAAGVRTFVWDMAEGSLDGLPDDFTHVMHAALLAERGDDFDKAVEQSCRPVAALMGHCRRAEAFLFVSTTAVYNVLEPGRLHRETDPIGGTSGGGHPPTYAAGKISAEGAVRALSHALQIPTTIARLSMQCGGTAGVPAWRGGAPAFYYKAIRDGRPVPVRPQRDDYCSLHHIDDIVRQVPLLWDVASVPTTVVNWGGDDRVSAREMIEHIGQLIGVAPTYLETEAAFGMVALDPTRRQSLIGRCKVDWRTGLARMLEEQKQLEAAA